MAIFDRIVPHFMARLMADFDCTAEDAAAVFGNAGHESAGLEKLQEIRPTVPGSRGGWGWFQWTGPRRRQMEAYAKRHGYDLRDPETNYKWLFVELTTTEKRTMPAVMATEGLHQKTKVFEKCFERAGIKHYPSRYAWADRALKAYHETMPVPVPEPPPPPDIDPAPDTAQPSRTRLFGGFFVALLTFLKRIMT